MLISRFSTDITPFEGADNRIITATEIDTPIGAMNAAAIDQGICLLDFADREKLASQVSNLQNTFSATLKNGENHHLENLKVQLGEYFSKKRTMFAFNFIRHRISK